MFDSQEYLKTSCRGLVCLSTLLPQIGRRFPNASVEIEFDAVEPPMLSITTSNIQAHGNATANITARLNNGSQVYLFRVRISAASNISVLVDDDRLKGKVESFVPVVTIIDSQIGGISEMALQFAINILSKAELARVNKEGEKGIPLPKLDQFTLTRSSIQLDEHCLTIISDVRYSPKKKWVSSFTAKLTVCQLCQVQRLWTVKFISVTNNIIVEFSFTSMLHKYIATIMFCFCFLFNVRSQKLLDQFSQNCKESCITV